MADQMVTRAADALGMLPQPEQLADLMKEAYPELRRIAGYYFRRESPHQTLHRTALVHEAFIRLTKHGPKKYFNRAHFFAVVGHAMKQILIEHARGRNARKRGRDWQRVPFDEIDVASPETVDGIALVEALERLTSLDAKLGQLVELRLVVGLSSTETATVLGRGASTVRRDWAVARAWLQRELKASTT